MREILTIPVDEQPSYPGNRKMERRIKSIIELILPAISENVESGEVIAVLVSVGNVVEKDQPVAECGLSEEQAKSQGGAYKVARFP